MGSKDKRKHKRKEKEPRSPKSFENQPPLDVDKRGLMQKVNAGHCVNNVLGTCRDGRHMPYSLFGDDIPQMNEKYARDMEKHRLKIVLKRGQKGSGQKGRYRVVKKMKRGQNVYLVEDSDTNKVHFMKAASVDCFGRDSNIARDLKVLENSMRTHKMFRQHFLGKIDEGTVTDKYTFLITQLGGRNLADIREKLGNSLEFLKTDAVRLCMQTLQAIHDVHLCRFVHRDIQPRNFVVGLWRASNMIYVVNFGLSYEYHAEKKTTSLLAKNKSLSRLFQARAFHVGAEYNVLEDMESWLYMCYWLFDSKSLPWNALASAKLDKIDERKVVICKELFLSGFFDSALAKKIDDCVLKFLEAMRYKIKIESVTGWTGHMDYSFFGDTILSMADELAVNWNAKYQWQNYVSLAPGKKPKYESKKPSKPAKSVDVSKESKTNYDSIDTTQDSTMPMENLWRNKIHVARSVTTDEKEKKKGKPPTVSSKDETADESSSNENTTEEQSSAKTTEEEESS